jgi:hypothetical protein
MAAARRTTARTTRETRVTSRVGTDAGAEVAPASTGLGLAETIGIVTAVLLLGAILAMDYAAGTLYGKGIFF